MRCPANCGFARSGRVMLNQLPKSIVRSCASVYESTRPECCAPVVRSTVVSCTHTSTRSLVSCRSHSRKSVPSRSALSYAGRVCSGAS
jgi:hypothetical protein